MRKDSHVFTSSGFQTKLLPYLFLSQISDNGTEGICFHYLKYSSTLGKRRVPHIVLVLDGNNSNHLYANKWALTNHLKIVTNKLITYKSCTYKQDLALNNPLGLIYHKTPTTWPKL